MLWSITEIKFITCYPQTLREYQAHFPKSHDTFSIGRNKKYSGGNWWLIDVYNTWILPLDDCVHIFLAFYVPFFFQKKYIKNLVYRRKPWWSTTIWFPGSTSGNIGRAMSRLASTNPVGRPGGESVSNKICFITFSCYLLIANADRSLSN